MRGEAAARARILAPTLFRSGMERSRLMLALAVLDRHLRVRTAAIRGLASRALSLPIRAKDALQKAARVAGGSQQAVPVGRRHLALVMFGGRVVTAVLAGLRTSRSVAVVAVVAQRDRTGQAQAAALRVKPVRALAAVAPTEVALVDRQQPVSVLLEVMARMQSAAAEKVETDLTEAVEEVVAPLVVAVTAALVRNMAPLALEEVAAEAPAFSAPTAATADTTVVVAVAAVRRAFPYSAATALKG